MKPKKNKKTPIPIDIRTKVWRNWCGGNMDGKCFCCDIDIKWEKWECGHIHAEAQGGAITEDNLRPICKPCNRSMSSQHMYLYMFNNDLNGIKNLDIKNSEVQKRKEEAHNIKMANQKIDTLLITGKVKKTEANNMKRKVNNKRDNTVNRLHHIQEIKKK
jgi:hypothetical protein